MPSNLREYMSRNNVTNSSRGSFDNRREEERDREREDMRGENQRKFFQSKNECIEELTQILNELQKKQIEMKRVADSHNSNVLKKYNEEYDILAQQILRQVQLHLRDNKERIMRQIKERRAIEMAQCKPVRRNIDKLREQVTTLREGLYRENQYRQYIAKIVLKDYEGELIYIQNDINRIRFPNVEVNMDDKYYSCFKNDLEKLIVLRDQMIGRNENYHQSYQSQSYQPSVRHEEINPHTNRDQIKRTAMNKHS